MESLKTEFFKATKEGLEIFKHYLQQPFKVDERVINNQLSFIVKWSSHYGNYALCNYRLNATDWEYIGCANPIFFVATKFGLSESQTYLKIDRDLELGILSVKVANSIRLIE